MQLDEIDDGLDALIRSYRAELGPLTDEQLDRKPQDGGWTAREVIGHLTLTVELYNEKLAELTARRPAGGGGSASEPRATLVGRLLLGLLRKEGAAMKKVGAPKTFKPDRLDRTYDVAGLVQAHEALRAHARAVRERGLGAQRIATPVSGLLRLRAHEALEVQLRHGRRHLAQALRTAQVEAAAPA